ncbi:hypothetical protein IB238_22910 [Rhizobium sp. ARZ01]|nr:hypothetical protein [Rhizobium sp. ARZ01]MBD9375471.1 hypothetical protein [Rhizobium sp. ARZ01]
MFSETLRLTYLNALDGLNYLLNDDIVGPWVLMIAMFIVWMAVLAY